MHWRVRCTRRRVGLRDDCDWLLSTFDPRLSEYSTPGSRPEHARFMHTFCPRPSARSPYLRPSARNPSTRYLLLPTFGEKPDSRSARCSASPPEPRNRYAAARDTAAPLSTGRTARSGENGTSPVGSYDPQSKTAHRGLTGPVRNPSESHVTAQNADFGPERRLGQSRRGNHRRLFLRNVQARYPFHDPRCVSKSAHYPVTFAWYRSHAATCRYKIGQTYRL